MAYIGIDPQRELIAICVIDKSMNVKLWLPIELKKRRECKKIGYENYLYQLCKYHIENILNMFIKIKGVFIESQRSAIHTRVEIMLYSIFRNMNIEVNTIHPTTWTSMLKIRNRNRNNNSNHNNKKLNIQMVSGILEEYIDEIDENDVIKTFQRRHDLCDAYLIAVSGLLSKVDENEKAIIINNIQCL